MTIRIEDRKRRPVNVTQWRRQIASFLKENPQPRPLFDFTIGWARTYDDLFDSNYNGNSAPTNLRHTALKTGRVLLCGRGGSAKTVIVRRLAAEAVRSGVMPIVVELRKWGAVRNRDEWDQVRQSPWPRIDYLLRRLAVPRLDTLTFAEMPPGTRVLLLVDGLNEVPSDVSAQIVTAIDDFSQYVPHVGTVITDRLTRRSLPRPESWSLATVRPLAKAEIKKQLRSKNAGRQVVGALADSTNPLLSTPYFLDAFLKNGHTDFDEYFRKVARLTDVELKRACRAAFQAYAKEHTRTFAATAFKRSAGARAVAKLRKNGDLLLQDRRAYFDHHLKHDFLVSHVLARDGSLWTRSVFDDVSFRANSFDVFALTLAQLPEQERADRFASCVYDWNQYGAAYSVVDVYGVRQNPLSAEMETVLLAMLAERRWDIMLSTRERVNDALRLFPDQIAQPFLQAHSRDDVRTAVLAVTSTKRWFLKWRELFSRKAKSSVPDGELRTLWSSDPVKGWTFANMLKRMRLSKGQQRTLLRKSSAAPPTVRWRIVHVLGSYPDKRNALYLLRAIEKDKDHWVRFGAVRSVIELAAVGDAALRRRVFVRLKALAGALVRDTRTIEEFGRAILIDEKRAPSGWTGAVVEVIQEVRDRIAAIETREQWERLAYAIKQRYGQ